MTLIERLLVQANKEANELADLLNEAAKALAQPQQEPVGEVTDAVGDAFKCEFKGPLSVGTKLYTSPPASTATSEDVRPALAAVQAGERERCARICEKRANFEPEYTAAMLHEVAEVLRGA